MLTKTLDKTYQIRSNYLDFHPTITTKMRSVLFDWLIEVIVERKKIKIIISFSKKGL
jgi:hypothetical protein